MATTRKRGEGRQAILDEARIAFGRDGYRATSLKEVAAAANVSMTLIYRYFGSKGGLFEEALIAPARAFIDGLLVGWESDRESTTRSVLIERFVRELYVFVSDNRGLFAAWADADQTEQAGFLADGSHGQAMRRLAGILGMSTPAEEAIALDEAQMVIACAGGLVLSFVLLKGVLLPADTPLRDREVQVLAITKAACAAADHSALGSEIHPFLVVPPTGFEPALPP